MSTEKETGGPAFPHPGGSRDSTVQKSYLGLSMRDYFAGEALAALIQMAYQAKNVKSIDDGPVTEETIAIQAYYFADAMLEARKK